MRVILVLAAITLLYLILRREYRKNPGQFTQKFIYWLLISGAVLLLLAAITGRLHWLYALIAGLVPMIGRVVSLVRFLPLLKSIQAAFGARASAGRPSKGQQSSVESSYFRMELDHDTGDISGLVLKGKHQGRSLADLDQQQLTALYEECIQSDTDSASLLAVYMDRKYGEQWQKNAEAGHAGSSGVNSGEEMTRTQALEILGLVDPVSEKDIIKAHRQLIQRFHPDRGGSHYLAAKINAAKDFLMNNG